MILHYDQLNGEILSNYSFKQLQEPEIRFPPTYRRLRDSNEDYSNKKNQSPSYTDRVIYYTKPHHKLVVDKYTSLEEQFGR